MRVAQARGCHARRDESTGSYWIPVFNVLEGHFSIVLANPEEVKNRKGHKTDRKDAEHLADLLRHNHVRASYIPPEPVRPLRDLTRRRIQLTQDASRERNRVQKLLEQANVKIASELIVSEPTCSWAIRNRSGKRSIAMTRPAPSR